MLTNNATLLAAMLNSPTHFNKGYFLLSKSLTITCTGLAYIRNQYYAMELFKLYIATQKAS